MAAARGCDPTLVVRTCGLYAASQSVPVRGRNFCDTVQSLTLDRQEIKVVCDQICTPSYVPHVANGILKLVASESLGTFHLTNSGACLRFYFASWLFKIPNEFTNFHECRPDFIA